MGFRTVKAWYLVLDLAGKSADRGKGEFGVVRGQRSSTAPRLVVGSSRWALSVGLWADRIHKIEQRPSLTDHLGRHCEDLLGYGEPP